MADGLDAARQLQEQIRQAVQDLGLEMDDEFTIAMSELQDILTFRLNILPGAMIVPEDFDEKEYDRMFKDITDQL